MFLLTLILPTPYWNVLPLTAQTVVFVCVCVRVTRAFCHAELGPALMSLTALTWRCCLWWLNRFSLYSEVCAVIFFLYYFWLSGFFFSFDLCISGQYTRNNFGVFSLVKKKKKSRFMTTKRCNTEPRQFVKAGQPNFKHSFVQRSTAVCPVPQALNDLHHKMQVPKGIQMFLCSKLKLENANRFLLLKCCCIKNIFHS